MRLRVQTDPFTTLLLAALGFAPIGACGGAVASNGGSGGDSGSGGQAVEGTGGVNGPGGDMARCGVDLCRQGTEYGTGGGLAGMGGFVLGGFDGGPGVGGGGPVNRFPCVTPPNVSAPNLGGYQSCSNGVLHREFKGVCPASLPRDTVFAVDGGLPDAGNYCQRDADCVAAPNGYCDYIDSLGGPRTLGPQCSYGCVRDEECKGMNQICVCGSPVGHCETATCSVDAQCGPTFLCASYVPNPGCPGEAFACQNPMDQCAVDADCPVGSRCGSSAPFSFGYRACSTVTCAVGRPFLVGGAPRLAPRSGGDAWQVEGARPNIARVSSGDRARLAEEWTKVGLMEHASIAAFARFTLQLMSLGASADLIERSNAATSDETLHAKLAFTIASAYAGRDVGPGRLDVRGALESGSLTEVLINVIREGCIGETVAAVEAAEALEHTVDPMVRDALARISKDELRHADLAWQFVRWVLESGGEDLRQVARREFEAARTSIPVRSVSPIGENESGLLAGGILPAALKREVHVATLERVVLVCARALLDPPIALLAS